MTGQIIVVAPRRSGKVRALIAAAVAAEREACAKVAEDYDGDGLTSHGYYDQGGDARQTVRDIAAAIRARQTET